MPRVLILDDNRIKSEKIRTAVLEVHGIDASDIHIVEDKVQARKALRAQHYDLWILDIQIPQRIGMTPERDGGVKLLKEIVETAEIYKLPDHVVAMTAYDETLTEVKEAFLEELVFAIHFKDGDDTWRKQLVRKVTYILEVERGIRESDKSESFDYDLGIVTALQSPELDAVFALAPRTSWKTIERNDDSSTCYHETTLNLGESHFRVVAASAPEMGMPASAALTMKMIYNFRPRIVAMTGIAAGLGTALNYGDILVANPSYDYGAGKYVEREGLAHFVPAPRQILLEVDVESKLKQLAENKQLLRDIRDRWNGSKPDNELRATLGPVASGAAVIAAQDFPETLIQEHNRKVVGIDMETYGFLHAARYCPRPRPIALCVKSISDFADKQKDDRFQKYAAYTSAEFLKSILPEFKL